MKNFLYQVVDDIIDLIQRLFYCFSILVFFTGFILILCSVLIPAIQCLFWLKDGIWHPMPLAAIISEQNQQEFMNNFSSWVGLQKLISSIFTFPLWAITLLCGFIVVYVGNEVSDGTKRIIDSRKYCPHCKKYFYETETVKKCPICDFKPAPKTEEA